MVDIRPNYTCISNSQLTLCDFNLSLLYNTFSTIVVRQIVQSWYCVQNKFFADKCILYICKDPKKVRDNPIDKHLMKKGLARLKVIPFLHWVNSPRIWIKRSTNASLAAIPAPASALIDKLAITLIAWKLNLVQ